jgi:fibronectin-binding autotransporter adhesin
MLAVFMAVATAGGLAIMAQPALAATLCVGSGPGCYTTIQAAVNAAQDGDTITIGPGTFAGGVTITKSVDLQGAGSAATIIRGGNSVLTIGAFGASSEPTVSITGVTITGGVARSSPESIPFTGKDGVWAAGGGIEIPPGAHLAVGATVTIFDSVITGNHVDPRNTVPAGFSCPGHFPKGQCPFAPAWGGGIDSWGIVALTRTAVTDNSVGAAPGLPGIASDADGAGIYSRQGSLTLTNTVVSGNHATATIPDGRFAEGAAIFAGYSGFGPSGGSNALAFENSAITGNSVILISDFPRFFGGKFQDLVANSGGIVDDPGVSTTTVEHTLVADNSAIATDLKGEPSAIDAAMNVSNGSLAMTGSVISGNRAITYSSTSADVGPAGSALEVDGGGTISNTRITDNYSSMVSPHGAAAVNGALGLFGNGSLLTVQDSTISGNAAAATSTTGSVSVQGAGVFNDGLLTLADDNVSGNSGAATGPSGVAQGGGIWNGTTFTGPPVQLTLQHTAVTRNSLTGSHGVTVQGGGLFTAPPVTIIVTDSVIALNVPDQCFGC